MITTFVSRASSKPDVPPTPPRVPYRPAAPEPDARSVASFDQLFLPAQVWTAHLRFTAAQWEKIQPVSIPKTPGWLKPGQAPTLNNTNAPRPGITGVFGFAQPWSAADFEFGVSNTVAFSNAAVRYKGNGTFLFAREFYARPFKIDLEREFPGRQFAGQAEFNFHNLTADPSFLRDALGYEFYRDAGLPASRTTFARLFMTIDGRWEHRYIGFYAVIEDPGQAWLDRSLGTTEAVLFKPVTPDLFLDLGSSWDAYVPVYHPKSKVPPQAQQRLIDLCRLVTHADDNAFHRQLGEFFDLTLLARFLACETLISNYDGIFSMGQNYLFWLDPRSQRFGFSPWDLDQSWGQFDQIGSASDRVRVDLFHPWLSPHRFFERVFASPEFIEQYRAELRRLLDTVFVPDRLSQRIDELATAIRPAIEELPEDRFNEFERLVAAPVPDVPSQGAESKARNQPHQDLKNFKTFIQRRAKEARDQLEGRSKGVIIRR